MPDAGERSLCSEKIFIPPSFPSIIKGYCKAAIRTQPYDLLKWSAAYFRALANGENPPAKERLEFPSSIEHGLTPGYLKALINLLGKNPSTEATADLVTEKWTALCLPPSDLRHILTTLKDETFPWLHFVAIAATSISSCLTQTMILLCEVLTDDPEGGRAAIPVDIFLDLYEYLGSSGKIPTKQTESVKEFMRLWADRQDGLIMPRNIRHWMCPSLDKLTV